MNYKSIKSHIQMPKSILKEFSNRESNKNSHGLPAPQYYIYQMDYNCVIKKINIKNANVKYGYYSLEIENKLSDIESAIGNIKTKAKNISDGFITLSSLDIENLLAYCTTTFLRSPDLLNAIMQYSQNRNINSHQDILLKAYFENPKNFAFFEEYNNFSILENRSSKNFLLPQLGVVRITLAYTPMITIFPQNLYFPMTPKLALVLSNKQTTFSNILIKQIITDDYIDEFNKIVIKTEFINNKKAIYAKEKQDLQNYLEYAKNIRFDL